MQMNEVSISGEVASDPIFSKTNGTASLFIDLSHQVTASDFELVRCLAVGEVAMNLFHLQKGESILVKGKLRTGQNGASKVRGEAQIECSQVMKCEFISPKNFGGSTR
jgi:single-stranded DNA-binding protein